MRQPSTRPPWALDGVELTRREAEVLFQVAQGRTNADIGWRLGVSSRTVEKHLQHIYKKLGVGTRTAAATVALGWRSGVEAAPLRRMPPQDGEPYRLRRSVTVQERNQLCEKEEG